MIESQIVDEQLKLFVIDINSSDCINIYKNTTTFYTYSNIERLHISILNCSNF